MLKPIWFAAFQPCGSRLAALLPEWLPAYEHDHRRLDADVRRSLLSASARTLDRLLAPLRATLRRRGGTRPGSLLRQSIPVRGTWEEQGAGWLEIDTVALCGGTLDDRHAWMLDAVDIRTDWTEVRALANRSQACTLAQFKDLEASLPFALRGVDSDNGGEFINHHFVAWLHHRQPPVLFTRSRPYHKNDNAHVEQRNWTHVRQHFGYERYDNPAVVPLLNELCRGCLGRLHNHFCPPTNWSKRNGARANPRCASMVTRRPPTRASSWPPKSARKQRPNCAPCTGNSTRFNSHGRSNKRRNLSRPGGCCGLEKPKAPAIARAPLKTERRKREQRFLTARFLRFQGQPWVTPFWRNEALFALYPGNSWFWRTTNAGQPSVSGVRFRHAAPGLDALVKVRSDRMFVKVDDTRRRQEADLFAEDARFPEHQGHACRP